MRKLLTALATAAMLLASNALIWKAEAAMVTGVGNLPLPNSYSPVEKIRCVCGPYGCACGRRHWRPYGSPATRAIGRIDITALAIGPTVRIAGAGSKEPEPKSS